MEQEQRAANCLKIRAILYRWAVWIKTKDRGDKKRFLSLR